MTTEHPIVAPRKLIEVALPLDAINRASAATKRKAPKGYPTTLHTWWAQRPLAAARAVIFSQLVNDPEDLWRCQNPGKEPNKQTKGHWTKARDRLFTILEDLVKWENTTNPIVLERARQAIRQSWLETCELNQDHPRAEQLFNVDNMPGLHDPFAGGGSIPLEAQRLGLEAHASDLNPVAVLINKAMIEIPSKFAANAPVNSEARRRLIKTDGANAAGLAEDVRHYGKWINSEAQKRIGHLYPPIEITKQMAKDRPDLLPYEGRELPVVAWLWSRTVNSPNPAFSHVEVPLASTFVLSSKPGKESYVQPVIEKDGYRFVVKVGKPSAEAKAGTKIGRGGNFQCIMSGSPISVQSIRDAGTAGRLGQRLMAIVVEGSRSRLFISPSEIAEQTAYSANPEWRPELPIARNPRDIRCQLYGLMTYADLFTPRQLVALTTFSDLVSEVRGQVLCDAVAAGRPDDDQPLAAGGEGARAYGEAVSLYLAFTLSRVADYGCSIATWRTKDNAMRSMFSKQAIPMTWDFAEGSPFGKSSSGFMEAIKVITNVFPHFCGVARGSANQQAAQSKSAVANRFISTDPPYYDNIGYADLSDFFYVWFRRSLRDVFPDVLATLAVPKAEELVAAPYRHGTKQKAEGFFLASSAESVGGIGLRQPSQLVI